MRLTEDAAADIAMVPARGKFCELCTPPVHYLLGCTGCRHQWHEPPSPGVFLCPKCGTEVLVSRLEHAKWEGNLVTASRVLRVGGLLREND